MFGTNRKGVSAYASVGVETGVAAASPHKLIVMLFEGAMLAVFTATRQMEAGDIAGKGKSISRAITIIENGLRASLDRKAGGQIAANLDALYEYMGNRLLLANRDNDAAVLDEVHRLLGELKGAWEAIGAPASNPAVAAPQPRATTGYESAPSAGVLMRA